MRVEPKPASSDVSGDYPAVPSPQQFSAVSPTIAVRFDPPFLFCDWNVRLIANRRLPDAVEEGNHEGPGQGLQR